MGCHFFKEVFEVAGGVIILIDLPEVALVFVGQAFVVRVNELRPSKWT